MTEDTKVTAAKLIASLNKQIADATAYIEANKLPVNEYVIVGRHGSVFNLRPGYKVTDAKYEYDMAGVGMNVTTMLKHHAEVTLVGVQKRDEDARIVRKLDYARDVLKTQSELLAMVSKSAE